MLWGTCQLSKPQKQSMGDNAMESNTAFVNNRPRITRGLKKSIDRFVKYRYGLYFSFKWCNEARYHLMLCCKKCISLPSHTKKGFPGGSVVKIPPASAGDTGREDLPTGRKIPRRRTWQPAPVFLPEKSHGQRSLAGDSLWITKELAMTYWQNTTITQKWLL